MNFVKKDTRQQRIKVRQEDEFDIFNGVVNSYNKRIKKWDSDEKSISLDRVEFDNEKQSAKAETV